MLQDCLDADGKCFCDSRVGFALGDQWENLHLARALVRDVSLGCPLRPAAASPATTIRRSFTRALQNRSNSAHPIG